DPVLGPRNLEMRTICIDRNDNIWVGAINAGVALFDRRSKQFKLVTDTLLGPATRNTYINHLLEDSKGSIWACSYGGMYMIDPLTHHITTFENHPVLKELNDKPVISFYEDQGKKLWIGTQRFGIYCYDPQLNRLTNYSTQNGLLNN